MVLLNSKTLMITDRINRRYRIVDLENKSVSSICNVEEKYDGPIGSIAGCRLHSPFTQLYTYHINHSSCLQMEDLSSSLRLQVRQHWRFCEHGMMQTYLLYQGPLQLRDKPVTTKRIVAYRRPAKASETYIIRYEIYLITNRRGSTMEPSYITSCFTVNKLASIKIWPQEQV